MELPKMEDVVARLDNPAPVQVKVNLFQLALQHALQKRNDRLIYQKPLRRGHLVLHRNPYKRRYTIARVKRAQYENAQNDRRVYIRAYHGGHF